MTSDFSRHSQVVRPARGEPPAPNKPPARPDPLEDARAQRIRDEASEVFTEGRIHRNTQPNRKQP